MKHPADCLNEISQFEFKEWLLPAMTQSECLNASVGRYGCQLPGTIAYPARNLLWITNETQCDVDGMLYGNFRENELRKQTKINPIPI